MALSEAGDAGLMLVRSGPEEHELLSDYLKDRFRSGPLAVLEAGCGQKWGLDLGGMDLHITGVDLDEESMRIRRDNEGDLDEAIVGDLRTVDLGDRRFDLVYSSFVLEHVSGAERVLDRFVEWLNPGGVIVLRIPDRETVFGFIANHTPFWLHVAYWKYILRQGNAGKPGHGPFPTFYDAVVSRRGIHRFCQSRGLRIGAEYGSNYYLKRLGRMGPLVHLVLKGIGAASFGRLSADHNNLLFVLEKP
jgi:SAM-dependent methyltransferase